MMVEGSSLVKSPLVHLVLVVVTIAIVGCGNNQNVLEAASSEEVSATSSYSPVVEVILPGGLGLCTGTFISPRAVLTAAHCTLHGGSYTIYSSFGMFTTSQRSVLGPGLVNDPNDIAVLVFDHDVADPAQGQVMALGDAPHVGNQIRIVGFGCNDLDAKTGAGVKRTGTNRLMAVTDYLELDTTPNQRLLDSHRNAHGILGPSNQAGSCFGDSGGPMMQSQGNSVKLVGVTHAGGWGTQYIISQYVNLNRGDNVNFLHDVDRNYSLNLYTGCWNSDEPEACGPSSAGFRIFSYFTRIWAKILSFF